MSLNLFRNYIRCLQKYDDFTGKSSRVEFWSFILVNLIICFLIVILFGDNSKTYIVYRVFVMIPLLAVTVRRLHDVGKTGEILIAIPLSAFLGYVFIGSKISNVFGILFILITLILNFRLFFLLIQDTKKKVKNYRNL